MAIFYILLVSYILSVNFYAFLLVKSLREKEQALELKKQAEPLSSATSPQEKISDKSTGKLCITGLLGGAITVYVCMFLLKYKRSDLFLMVIMPLLGVLNVYFFILLFKSGFGFLLIR